MKRMPMSGKVFGRLLVLEERGKKVIAGCACGIVKEFARGNVLAGYTQSCGCLQRERTSAANLIHGHANPPSPTYTSWRNLKARCENPAHEHYKNYGGRGITYCTRWSYFENFLEDMGERPEGKEIDRIDGNGNYEPGNCRWLTHEENVKNKR